MRHPLLSLMLFQLGLMYISLSHADGYEFGQGWRSGNYYLSGYTNIELIDRFGTPAKLDVDDLSLFAGGHVNRWVNPFAEVELSKHTLLRQGGGAANGDVIVERFYNDITLSEHDTMRVGKMLTPLGDWNLVHAAPLIPIITRPYTTSRGFAAYASGLTWMHEPGGGVNWQLYWQPDNELFKRPVTQTIRNFHNVIGGQVSKLLGMNDKVGFSFQHGTLIETRETFTLFGLHANQSFGKLKLESEAITAKFSGTSPRAHDTESGIFALADYAITPQWHGIAGAEYYQDHTVAQSSRSTLLAVSYKPQTPVVWKLEYIHQAGVPASVAIIRTGLKGSLSFFF